MDQGQPRSPLSLPGHSLVLNPSPPPRGTVTYLAGTVCSQGTRDTGRSRTRCPVPARRRALGDRESGRALSTLPAREAQRVPPTAPTTTKTSGRGARGEPALPSGRYPGGVRLTGCGTSDALGLGPPDPVHTQCRKVTVLGRAECAHWGTSIPLGTPGDKDFTCALVVRERLWA